MSKDSPAGSGPIPPGPPDPTCPACGGAEGRIFRAGTGGPQRILVSYHCDNCGHEWQLVWHQDDRG